ncbi:MAG TPA: FkbM family methyltransferase [Lacipirellulaceae bacterium]|nr:FkbM family methyltransferase [Lacipirellulaceae bacterium]
MPLKSIAQQLFHAFGYHLSSYRRDRCGIDPLQDMTRFVPDGSDRTIFDVGANRGQFLDQLRLRFPKARIHSFEPSPATFQALSAKVAGMTNVSTWNLALGANAGKSMLLENVSSDMSSMLQLGSQGWGRIEKQTEIDIQSVDDFCQEHSISRVDILKSDTQGYDLEVFKGAERMMRENRIGLVYSEITFDEIYKNLPPFDEILRFLRERDFVLAAFYKMEFRRPIVGWTDALFVNRQLLNRTLGPQRPSNGI